MLKIGVTERGDPAKDWRWAETVRSCDGAIIITKSITNFVAKNLLQLCSKNFPVILHATCTGHGGTVLEPNVPAYQTQLNSIRRLLDTGFSKSNLVLRIDPIIPTASGLQAVKNVLNEALRLNILPSCRVRVSILDEYRHVKERLTNAGLPHNFPGRFTASASQIQTLTGTLRPYYDKYGIQFECCAETNLTDGIYKHVGCVSLQDLTIMGLDLSQLSASDLSVNPQNRHGCGCLSCKHELLTRRVQCPHQCLYCYWKN